jgi:hypothetical protein
MQKTIINLFINKPIGLVLAAIGGYVIWLHLALNLPTHRTIKVPIFVLQDKETICSMPQEACVTFVGERYLLQHLERVNPSIQVPHTAEKNITLEPYMVLCNTAVEAIQIVPKQIQINKQS